MYVKTVNRVVTLLLAALLGLTACAPSEGPGASRWEGTVDTLPSGQLRVANPDDGLWAEGEGWRVIEELRIGSVAAEGPELFGSITSIEVDPLGRIYVYERQSQELRVFNPDGSHLRTIGRKGGGPGEFGTATLVQLGPDGHLWVVDPPNSRVSVFDTAGVYLDSKRQPGGFTISPWPGGFDDSGYYYHPLPVRGAGVFRLGLVRYDPAFQPIDTVSTPAYPVERDLFRLEAGDSFMIAAVPFSPGFEWQLARTGTFWAMLTGEYRLFELSLDGDTLRSMTRAFEPLPVTSRDVEEAMQGLEWFVSQGGKVDRSRIPDRKPATRDFFLDDRGNLWVIPVTSSELEGRMVDVFNPELRYLGRMELPFPIRLRPRPLVRGSVMYAVTEDELEVPFVIRARIEKRVDSER